MAKLTSALRNALPKSSFIFPGKRAYPIPDKAHGISALRLVGMHGTPAQKTRVRAAVHKKFPAIGKR